MAFTCKFPNSRRQTWEKCNKTTQFNIRKACQYYYDERFDEVDGQERYITSALRGRSENTVDIGDNDRLTRRAAAAAAAEEEDSAEDTTTEVKRPELPEKIPFSVVDILSILASIILYCWDVVSDCLIAQQHWQRREEHPLYFSFTLTFILLAGVVSSVLSFWWYYFEYKEQSATGLKKRNSQKPTCCVLVVRAFFCIFLFGPVLRYIDTVRFGLRSRQKNLSPEKRKYYHDMMNFERVDGAMLRLIECFLEAAPQLMLQVFIVLNEGLDGEKEGDLWKVTITIATISSSMFSLAWGMVAYHKALRISRYDRGNISHVGMVFRFLWRLFELSPRVIIFAMFMSKFTFYLGVVAGIHWGVMLVWLNRLHTQFCEKPRGEHLFIAVVALIWMFCFFNVKDGPSRRTALLYYTIFYLENVGLTLGWLSVTVVGDVAYDCRYILTGVMLGSMWVAVICMLIYYVFFHPHQIDLLLPPTYWTHSSCHHDQWNTEQKSSTEQTAIETTALVDTTKPGPDGESTSSPGKEASDTEQYTVEDQDTLNAPPPSYCAPTPELAHRILPPTPALDSNDEGYVPIDLDAEDDIPTYTAPHIDKNDSGYLQPVDMEQSIGLARQDSVPKYRAPVPVKSNYGATVPGGAPSIFKLHHTKHLDVKRSSTLPGTFAGPIMAKKSGNEESGNFSSNISDKSPAKDKPPMPLPRLSILESPEATGDSMENSLTFVTELSDLTSTLKSPAVPTPSPRHSMMRLSESEEEADSSINIDISLDDSVLNGSLPPATPTKPDNLRDGVLLRNASLLEGSSDTDTPLKSRDQMHVESGSPDTPMREFCASLAQQSNSSKD